ncbi:hypothetical protein T552_03470 [Pneumocystis carinii B80]|uniref:Uncharacterized protein n=1 Tax=Pneumocystis carinii (strain B80) TaxID=1408658 RepID=A0A0W4ZB11_PNEC8|nr:hypothetical protein T552_03470 [Pneumocystis carinii B80]KTW25610.1 hypothetical protein T552_03470 [Pneumocystis carinii B80]
MNTQKQNLINRVTPENKYKKSYSTNWQFFNTNDQSPETELINESMSHRMSITPHKELSHYAGPTFHHSPAASNLPIPSFFSKITYNTPHLQPLHFQQSSQHIQTSISSPSTSQIHSSKQLEETSEISLYEPSISLSHEVHSSSPKKLFKVDMNEKKERQALRKQETNASLEFNDTFYSKTYSSIKKIGKKKEVKENTLLSVYSDFHNTQRNQKDNHHQKTTFYKKNKMQLRKNMYIDNYNTNAEDMKQKLLSLLLPSKPNKSSANT